MAEDDEKGGTGGGATRVLAAVAELRKENAALLKRLEDTEARLVKCSGDECALEEKNRASLEAKLAENDKKLDAFIAENDKRFEALKAETKKRVEEDGAITRGLSYAILKKLSAAANAAPEPETAKCPWADCGKESPLPDGIGPGDELRCDHCHKKFTAQPDAEEEDAGEDDDEAAGDETTEPEA